MEFQKKLTVLLDNCFSDSLAIALSLFFKKENKRD